MRLKGVGYYGLWINRVMRLKRKENERDDSGGEVEVLWKEQHVPPLPLAQRQRFLYSVVPPVRYLHSWSILAILVRRISFPGRLSYTPFHSPYRALTSVIDPLRYCFASPVLLQAPDVKDMRVRHAHRPRVVDV